MAFYCPWRLYGNHNQKLLGEVIKSNNPTVISKERTRAFVFIYLHVWFEAERSRGDSVLVSSSKLWFLFMCLSGNRPRRNRRLQSIVADTTQGSDRFSLHLHPAAMNKCCLWTSTTVWVSDHAGLALLRWEVLYGLWIVFVHLLHNVTASKGGGHVKVSLSLILSVTSMVLWTPAWMIIGPLFHSGLFQQLFAWTAMKFFFFFFFFLLQFFVALTQF